MTSRRVLITGASKGIGYALAELLAAAGYSWQTGAHLLRCCQSRAGVLLPRLGRRADHHRDHRQLRRPRTH
jgi:NAD(P)-dependent dehydrogenase (short-subunit alcohol dehydrogenase family)